MLCTRMSPEEDLFDAAVKRADERRARRILNYVPPPWIWNEVDIIPELEREAIEAFERKFFESK